MKIIDEDKRKVRLNLDLPYPLLRAMKMHSLKLSGCKRPNVGSEAHFARTSILWFMRDIIRVDFEKINSDIYKIPEVKSIR
jgi:hypothetical protein